MKKLLLKALHRLLLNDIGKKEAQSVFEQLYDMAIAGMNYGYGDKLETSGEDNVLNYIKNGIGETPILFDVGANKGQYVIVLASIFPNAEIHSFEPSLKVFSELKKNVRNKNVILHNIGLGETPALLPLYSSPVTSEISSVYPRRLDHINISMKEGETIELTTLDDFCRLNNIEFIDFLKMDIEGHELAALKGADSFLKDKKIKFIQFEFGGTNIDSRTYFQDFWYLLKEDYKIYRIVKNGLQPILKYKETFEIFTTINYLAELKA